MSLCARCNRTPGDVIRVNITKGPPGQETPWREYVLSCFAGGAAPNYPEADGRGGRLSAEGDPFSLHPWTKPNYLRPTPFYIDLQQRHCDLSVEACSPCRTGIDV